MSRIIINNQTSVSDEWALAYAAAVARGGNVSTTAGVKHWCSVMTFKAKDECPPIVAYTRKSRSGTTTVTLMLDDLSAQVTAP